jgi:hypothetical protein
MTTRSLDELRELAPGYVMQTLTDDEQAAFTAALRDPSMAADLEAELAAHRAALEYVAAAHAVTPPPDLRTRVLDRIGAERAATASAAAASPVLHVERGGATQAAPARGRLLTGALITALAASVVFAVMQREQLQSAQADLTAQRAQFAEARARLAERDALVRTLTNSGGDVVRVQLLPGTTAAPSMQVYWDVPRGRAVVIAAGLKPIAADRAYCLWIIRDGKPVALTLFRPDAGGAQLLSELEVPTSRQGVAAFAVTEEPATGSPQPTMTPFLVGAVSATQ